MGSEREAADLDGGHQNSGPRSHTLQSYVARPSSRTVKGLESDPDIENHWSTRRPSKTDPAQLEVNGRYHVCPIVLKFGIKTGQPGRDQRLSQYKMDLAVLARGPIACSTRRKSSGQHS